MPEWIGYETKKGDIRNHAVDVYLDSGRIVTRCGMLANKKQTRGVRFDSCGMPEDENCKHCVALTRHAKQENRE